jgi:hypothetical protein
MFERWKKYRALATALRRNRSSFVNQIAVAKEKGAARDELEEIESSFSFDAALILEEYQWLQTRDMRDRAAMLGVPTPEGEEYWEDLTHTQRSRVLTTKGMHELRRAIRTERLERWQWAFNWIGALTGLVGALIGLVSVL